jgi:hypothetical protein
VTTAWMTQPWPPMKKSASPAPSSSHRHSTCMHATHLSLSTVSRAVCNMRRPSPRASYERLPTPVALCRRFLLMLGVAKTDIDVFEHRTCYGRNYIVGSRNSLCCLDGMSARAIRDRRRARRSPRSAFRRSHRHTPVWRHSGHEILN